jgi:hypothetical protein
MGELVDYFANIVIDFLCIPMVSEPMYRRGFLVALVFTFLIGKGTRMFLFARGQIVTFFSTIQPSLKPSPSGYERMNGCTAGMITIGALAVISCTSVWIFLYALSR